MLFVSHNPVACGGEGKGVVYKLADTLATPDFYHTKDYDSTHRTQGSTIVIDNGQCVLKVKIVSAIFGFGACCR